MPIGPTAHIIIARAAVHKVHTTMANQNVMTTRTPQNIIQIASDKVVIGMGACDVDPLKPVDLNFGVLVEAPVPNVAQVNV